jgi:aldehyde:ferredoxin oxidoreductase
LVDDLETLIRANELCNRYGLDTIGTGSAVAFGMEAYERGLINDSDTDGLKLEWGSAEALLATIEAIAEGKGIGELLSKGTRQAAQDLGGEAQMLAVHVKGLDCPGHDGRAYNSAALAYATATRGACHLEAISHVVERSVPFDEIGFPEVLDRFAVDRKAELVVKLQDLMCLYDSLKMCKFVWFAGVKVANLLNLLNLTTGWELDMAEFMQSGERIFNLKKLANIKLGASRVDDSLPVRMLSQPRGSGTAADNLPPLEAMLDDYYKLRGWTHQGEPTPTKLSELDIEGYA